MSVETSEPKNKVVKKPREQLVVDSPDEFKKKVLLGTETEESNASKSVDISEIPSEEPDHVNLNTEEKINHTTVELIVETDSEESMKQREREKNVLLAEEMEEKELEESLRTAEDGSQSISDMVEERFNYASLDAGAIILASNKGMKHSSSLLVEDRDKYALSPCEEEKKWVVLGLSEEIKPEEFLLANYEKFSSTISKFTLLGSNTYPCKEWFVLGEYEAGEEQGVQRFKIQNSAWVRYLLFRFSSWYGEDYYCTVSEIRVYGSTDQFHTIHEDFNSKNIEAEKLKLSIDKAVMLEGGTKQRAAEVEVEILSVADHTIEHDADDDMVSPTHEVQQDEEEQVGKTEGSSGIEEPVILSTNEDSNAPAESVNETVVDPVEIESTLIEDSESTVEDEEAQEELVPDIVESVIVEIVDIEENTIFPPIENGTKECEARFPNNETNITQVAEEFSDDAIEEKVIPDIVEIEKKQAESIEESDGAIMNGVRRSVVSPPAATGGKNSMEKVFQSLTTKILGIEVEQSVFKKYLEETNIKYAAAIRELQVDLQESEQLAGEAKTRSIDVQDDMSILSKTTKSHIDKYTSSMASIKKDLELVSIRQDWLEGRLGDILLVNILFGFIILVSFLS